MQSTKQSIFLTGATGLLGSYLLKLFLEHGHKVYVLARGKDKKSAQQRVEEFVSFWDEGALHANKGNLIVVEGDITYPDLGINSSKIIGELSSDIEIIYHCAALTKVRAPLEIIRKVNVQGTRNILDLALRCKETGRLKKVNYISTSYIGGISGDEAFSKDKFELGQRLHNNYEQTKYEAESLVYGYKKHGLDISVLRSGMIIGDSSNGKTTNFRLFYEPLHFLSQEIYDEFPVEEKLPINLINVDTIAKASFTLGQLEDADVYHITSPQSVSIAFFMHLASKFFRFKMPRLVHLKKFSFDLWTPVQKTLAGPFVPYFNYQTTFLAEKTQDLLFRKGLTFPNIDKDNLLRIFRYCQDRGFIDPKISSAFMNEFENSLSPYSTIKSLAASLKERH